MSPADSIQFTLSPSVASEDMETRGQELASRCWDDNNEFLPKEKIAEWLGGQYVFCISSQ